MIVRSLAVVYLCTLAIKCRLAWRYAKTETQRWAKRSEPLPETTIVQPILSGDPRLERTLEHNIRELGEPHFLWVIDENDDEARRIATVLSSRYPDRSIDVVLTPQPPDTLNPKLFKLERARATIATDVVLVLDDDTKLSSIGYATLLRALAEYTLSTGMPSYEDGGDWWNSLVSRFVNDNGACTYLAFSAVRSPITINGMCYALETKTLAEMDGFTSILHVLGDDLAMARAVIDRGGSLYQSPHPHRSATTVAGPRHYVSLMHRWFLFASLLLEGEAPPLAAGLGAAFLAPLVMLWIVIGRALLTRRSRDVATMLGVLAVRELVLGNAERAILGRERRAPLASLVAELLQPFHAIHGVVRRTIRWRSRTYRVRANDDFTEIASE